MTQLDLTKYPSERFWSKVNKLESCWIWTGSRNGDGYGTISWCKRTISAHRVAWSLQYGPIPDGLSVLHTCDNPPCMRGEHLFLGTQLDNMVDCASKGRSGPQVHPERLAMFKHRSTTHPETLKRGEDHHGSKLTVDEVLQMRVDYTTGISTAKLGERYGVSQANAYRIVKRQLWTHV